MERSEEPRAKCCSARSWKSPNELLPCSLDMSCFSDLRDAICAGCRASDNAQASGNVAGLAGAAPGSCVLQVANITNIALAFGFSIFVLVYATAAYTGATSLLSHSVL